MWIEYLVIVVRVPKIQESADNGHMHYKERRKALHGLVAFQTRTNFGWYLLGNELYLNRIQNFKGFQQLFAQWKDYESSFSTETSIF